jgi:precorrin-6B methylase 2
MVWYFDVVERRHHLQNPTSRDKILLLGERLGLGPGSHVLDVASGKAGPAVLLAQAYGCRIICVERAEEFHRVARARVESAGLGNRIDLVLADARDHPFDAEGFDAALCLGASFVWDGLVGTLDALLPAVRPSGFVVVSEPYWRTWPLPDGFEPDPGEAFEPLPETIGRFVAAGLAPVTMIDASLDDWDTYETLHWLAADEWLRGHPDDPDAEEIRSRSERNRQRYVRWERDLLGWAIFAGRKA